MTMQEERRPASAVISTFFTFAAFAGLGVLCHTLFSERLPSVEPIVAGSSDLPALLSGAFRASMPDLLVFLCLLFSSITFLFMQAVLLLSAFRGFTAALAFLSLAPHYPLDAAATAVCALILLALLCRLSQSAFCVDTALRDYNPASIRSTLVRAWYKTFLSAGACCFVHLLALLLS